MNNLDIHYTPSPALTQLAKTFEAELLWDFLCSPENQIRMETATFLRKPALEPLSPYLREKFEFFRVESADKATFDRFKQLAGSMTKQVMKELGYELEKNSVTVLRGGVFKTASRYVPIK
ncbi:hypothetical protein [Shewanella pealeana]|nr:hypothetical protein [Shewanella pealeana]